jgi:hypothetical protein
MARAEGVAGFEIAFVFTKEIGVSKVGGDVVRSIVSN